MDEIKSTLGLILSLQKDMKKDIGKLDQKIDNVEKRLNERIDKVEINLKKVEENLNEKIDKVETSLNEKIDKVETNLNEKIDKVEENLDHKIERVRVENLIYYMNLNQKLNDNLEDIGEMFRELYGNVPA